MASQLKIAVYTVALNEAQFAERWAKCCTDADYRVVADTGSTDNTVQRLRDLGVAVHSISVRPWRFDRARDASLALVPADADICVCLDMDEVLPRGWRERLLRAWTPGTNRLKHLYVWSWKDGKPAQTLIQDRIHGRHSHKWKYPAHECAVAVEGVQEVMAVDEGLVTEHHPDHSKSRSSYLGLLRIGAWEYPQDGRMAHYYGRELMFAGQHRAAIDELRRHVNLPHTWVVERAQSMLFLGRCHAALREFGTAERWFVSAADEFPGSRDPWVELAQMQHDRRDWIAGWMAAERALAIQKHSSDTPRNEASWGSLPWDLAGVCAWYAGARERGLECVRKAIELNPGEARLIKNLELMTRESEIKPRNGEMPGVLDPAISVALPEY
jgi:glycosyltransferase involved in cell wall biosynthesis